MSQVSPSDQQTHASIDPRFIQFVMTQAQQAALFLGQFPHPSTGEVTLNLEAAKLFIDHLEMIKEKTRGNLTSEEEDALTKVIADLQLTFVQVSKEDQGSKKEESAPSASAESGGPEIVVDTTEDISAQETTEGKKKFSKSYGA